MRSHVRLHVVAYRKPGKQGEIIDAPKAAFASSEPSGASTKPRRTRAGDVVLQIVDACSRRPWRAWESGQSPEMRRYRSPPGSEPAVARVYRRIPNNRVPARARIPTRRRAGERPCRDLGRAAPRSISLVRLGSGGAAVPSHGAGSQLGAQLLNGCFAIARDAGPGFERKRRCRRGEWRAAMPGRSDSSSRMCSALRSELRRYTEARSLPSRSSIAVGYSLAASFRYSDSSLGVTTSETNGSRPFSLYSVRG